jgi:hypothetical protein
MRRSVTVILAIPTFFNGLAMLVLPSALALYAAFPNQGEYHA